MIEIFIDFYKVKISNPFYSKIPRLIFTKLFRQLKIYPNFENQLKNPLYVRSWVKNQYFTQCVFIGLKISWIHLNYEIRPLLTDLRGGNKHKCPKNQLLLTQCKLLMVHNLSSVVKKNIKHHRAKIWFLTHDLTYNGFFNWLSKFGYIFSCLKSLEKIERGILE